MSRTFRMRFIFTLAVLSLWSTGQAFAEVIKYRINRLGNEQELIHFCWDRPAGHQQVIHSGQDPQMGFYVVCGDPRDLPVSTPDLVAWINHEIHQVPALTQLTEYCQNETPQTIRELADLPRHELSQADPYTYEKRRDLEKYLQAFNSNWNQWALVEYLNKMAQHPMIWLESGAGIGKAQREYLTRFPPEAGSQLISFAKYLPPNFEQIIETVRKVRYEHEFQYRYFVHPTEKEFLFPLKQKVDLITDYFGAFSYTPHFSKLLTFYGNYLKQGGRAYIIAAPNKMRFVDGQGRVLNLNEFINRHTKGFTLNHPDSKTYILERNSEPLEIPETLRVYVNPSKAPFEQLYQFHEEGGQKFALDPRFHFLWPPHEDSVASVDELREAADPNHRLELEVSVLSAEIESIKFDLDEGRIPAEHVNFEKERMGRYEKALHKREQALAAFEKQKAEGTYKDLTLQEMMDRLSPSLQEVPFEDDDWWQSL